jgi:hypothetical protein
MKNNLVLFIVFLFFGCFNDSDEGVQTLSAQDRDDLGIVNAQKGIDDGNTFAYFLSEGARVLIQENNATVFFFPSNEMQWIEIPISDLILTGEGWYTGKVMNWQFIALKGGNYFEFFDVDIKENSEFYFTLSVFKPHLEGNEHDKIDDFGIQSIEASSSFSEIVNGKTVIYAADKIDQIFFGDHLGISKYWNATHLPWVEGEDGPGIGVTLDVIFIEPSDHMLVLNGFVDPQRRHLFKANNRVKRALIRSLDADVSFSFEYTFSDTVEFSYIPFPEAVKNVQLEILEVYPGERWNDTAISAIIRNHTWEFNKRRLRNLIELKTPENKYRGEIQ